MQGACGVGAEGCLPTVPPGQQQPQWYRGTSVTSPGSLNCFSCSPTAVILDEGGKGRGGLGLFLAPSLPKKVTYSTRGGWEQETFSPTPTEKGCSALWLGRGKGMSWLFFGPGASWGCKDKVVTCVRLGAFQAAADPATSTGLRLLEGTLRKQNKNLMKLLFLNL